MVYSRHIPVFFNTTNIYLAYTRHINLKKTYAGHMRWLWQFFSDIHGISVVYTKIVMYILGIYLYISLHQILIHSISILKHSIWCCISIVYPYYYFFFTHPGRIRRLMPQVWRWACCARAGHSVCLSVMSCRICKWANQRESQVKGNSRWSFPKKIGMRRRRRRKTQKKM